MLRCDMTLAMTLWHNMMSWMTMSPNTSLMRGSSLSFCFIIQEMQSRILSWLLSQPHHIRGCGLRRLDICSLMTVVLLSWALALFFLLWPLMGLLVGTNKFYWPLYYFQKSTGELCVLVVMAAVITLAVIDARKCFYEPLPVQRSPEPRL